MSPEEQSDAISAVVKTLEVPVFEVRVGNPAGEHKHYRIYANGRTAGFEDGDKPVWVVNRMWQLQRGRG